MGATKKIKTLSSYKVLLDVEFWREIAKEFELKC